MGMQGRVHIRSLAAYAGGGHDLVGCCNLQDRWEARLDCTGATRRGGDPGLDGSRDRDLQRDLLTTAENLLGIKRELKLRGVVDRLVRARDFHHQKVSMTGNVSPRISMSGLCAGCIFSKEEKPTYFFDTKCPVSRREPTHFSGRRENGRLPDRTVLCWLERSTRASPIGTQL